MENIFVKMFNYIKNKLFKRKMLIEPIPNDYDEGINTVVMKKANFDNLKIDMSKIDKKVKLENGFISVYDLSDEEIEEMIQLYADELNNLNRQIKEKQLEVEKIEKKGMVQQ